MSLPNYEGCLQTKQYFSPFLEQKMTELLHNVTGEIKMISLGHQTFPLLVPQENTANSYVCSPFAHYVELPLQSLSMLSNKVVQNGAKTFFRMFGRFLTKCRINKIVYVNHWFFSTDLHTEKWESHFLETMTRSLASEYPDRAIAFRSVNASTTPALLAQLRQCGYAPVASRQVFISRPSDPQVHTTRIIKSDYKLLRESPYEFVASDQLTEKEVDEALRLHHKHTLANHSSYNPHITKKYFKTMIEQKLVHVMALRKDGVIHGVVGYIVRGNVMTCPVFGFDVVDSDKTRIYRLLSTYLFSIAKENQYVFHQSAGASFYKTVRRAKPVMEYMYVYTKHLRKRQMLGWRALQAFANTIAVPFMKKY